MTTKFLTWLWEQMPSYWHDNDTNKDVNGQGTAERLLSVMGLELDDEIVQKIDDYLDNLDPQVAPEDMLQHISDCLGNPPNMFTNTAQYRNILSYIVSVYKVKGTVAGYEAFFNLLGFDVTITEYENISGQYDNSVTYDQTDTTEVHLYDTTKCEPCADYEIVFTSQFPDTDSPDDLVPDALEKLEDAVTFVEPINANLIFTQYLIPIEDEITASVQECVEVFTITTTDYDGSVDEFDNTEYYDNPAQSLVYSVGEKAMGNLIDVDFGIDTLSDFTEVNKDGTVAYTLADGYLKMTGAPAATTPNDCYLRHDHINGLETWTFTTNYIVKSKVASDESFIFGLVPSTGAGAPSSTAPSILFYKQRNSGAGDDGDIFRTENGAAGVSFAVSSVPSSIDDEIQITVEKTWNELIVTTENVTNPEVLATTDTYDLSQFSTKLFTSSLQWVIGTGGGEHWVKYFRLHSDEIRNIEDGYLILGDDHSQGYTASTDAQRFISQLRAAHPDKVFTLEGGQGDNPQTLVDKAAQGLFIFHNPTKIILFNGSNGIIDNGLASTQSSYNSSLTPILELLPNITEILHVEALPRAGNTDINTWNTWLDTNYNSGIHSVIEINALFNNGSDELDPLYSDNGLHLNDDGHDLLFTTINAAI